MPRFFTDPIIGTEARISGEDAAHITRSLRLRPGEEITLCDGTGWDYAGRISAVGDPVVVEILSKSPSISEPHVKITLFQALPKGDKMEFIIQKSVELGVTRIVPLLTSRCVSRPDAKSMAKKLERYRKIAAEAAKQSGRGILPEVCPLVTLEEAARMLPEKSLIFYEGGGQRLCEMVSPADTEWAVFVGSEGGFSREEVNFLTEKGVHAATLGTRILRCETAPICGISVLLSLTGDI
ncbi:MAG: 16S rRNA (uracil(1498)-N(3))-methyltransferase [Candidatus Merdivicinus sp.]|jgi:16S rRNA (uracil1498-N3)-methyltransferase